MKGRVIWFKQSFGFLRADTTGDEFFVHKSEVNIEGTRPLMPNERVDFDVELGPKGRPQAVNVRLAK